LAKAPVPGLLPWQVLFLACAGGAWAVHDAATGFSAAALAALCNLIAGRKSPRVFIFALAALAGFAYAWLRLPHAPDVPVWPAWMDQRPRGVVSGRVESVEEKPGNRLEIILSSPVFRLESGETREIPGNLVWTWQDPAFRPAPESLVEVGARPHPTGGFDNPGGTDWAWRWRIKGVFFRAFSLGPKGAAVAEQAEENSLERWRMGLRDAILRGAGGGSPGGMVLGLTTGERFAITPADLDRVRRASLSHLLAVSGMNLAAVVAMGWALAWLAGIAWPGVYLHLPRPKLAVAAGFPLVACYLWLGRFEPSLVRAALMFASWGVLVWLGRPRVLLDGLFFALAAMFVWDPLCVFDVGLELSAAAVCGLVLLLPLAEPVFAWLGKAGPRRVAVVPLGWLLVTLAAQLSVLPIQFSVFGEASPHLYLNLLWAPLVDWAAQPLAYLGALTVTWWPGLGEPLLSWSARVCEVLLASLAYMDARGWLAVYPVQRPWQPEVLGYAVLLGGLAFVRGLSVPRRGAWLALCALLLAAPPLWRAFDQSRDQVRLTVLDVGQGQSVLVEAPGGRRYLVDGGGTLTGSFDLGRSVLSPALTWGRPPRVDGLVMSHPDRDHTGGFVYLLNTYGIGFLAGNGEMPRPEDFSRALGASGLSPRTWRAGERVELEPGLALEVLHPATGYHKSGNDASLVLRLVWRGRGLAILPGDAGKDALIPLEGSGKHMAADVLVVPHHGSRSALAPGFYRGVGAKWAFISCGRGNTFGFPAPEVVAALTQSGAATLSTAYSGALTATWESPHGPPTVRTMR
jgi:competence protein ComEC